MRGGMHNTYVTPDGKFAVAGSIAGRSMTVIDVDDRDAGVDDCSSTSGVRPMAFEPKADGSTSRMFVQISDFDGFRIVDFDQRARRSARVALPEVPGETRRRQVQGSPAHGIGVAPDGKILWVNSKVNSLRLCLFAAGPEAAAACTVGASSRLADLHARQPVRLYRERGLERRVGDRRRARSRRSRASPSARCRSATRSPPKRDSGSEIAVAGSLQASGASDRGASHGPIAPARWGPRLRARHANPTGFAPQNARISPPQSCPESYLSSGRNRCRAHQLPDRFEDHSKLPVILPLQHLKLRGKSLVGDSELSESDERAHDGDVRLHCPMAPEDTGQHRDTLLGKRIGAMATAAASV